ncbi:MAG: glycogen-binding domain-containing protein [Kiritimatiellae bacterium]|nr:glycogen-binding domain-containing protein [Kiritimatiellia bacterium]
MTKKQPKAAPAPKKAAARRSAAKSAPTPKPATRKAAPKGERKVITVQADPGSTVFLAGSFNNWDPAALRMTDKAGNGVFSATVTLAPGIYEYKFVINGVWTLDPDPERDWTQNGLGTLNSVLRV